jgi:hypothetical protein
MSTTCFCDLAESRSVTTAAQANGHCPPKLDQRDGAPCKNKLAVATSASFSRLRRGQATFDSDRPAGRSPKRRGGEQQQDHVARSPHGKHFRGLAAVGSSLLLPLRPRHDHALGDAVHWPQLLAHAIGGLASTPRPVEFRFCIGRRGPPRLIFIELRVAFPFRSQLPLIDHHTVPLTRGWARRSVRLFSCSILSDQDVGHIVVLGSARWFITFAIITASLTGLS